MGSFFFMCHVCLSKLQWSYGCRSSYLLIYIGSSPLSAEPDQNSAAFSLPLVSFFDIFFHAGILINNVIAIVTCRLASIPE